MMKILKASAGSGKTYNLARTYITLLLKSDDRYAYRHILAVTFTNKATAEMKNRILKELHILGTEPEKSDYFNDFVPSLLPDATALKERAGGVLVDILHDYGAFSVSTIDKFFQMTLKAFSREIGQFASYQVELDKKSLVHEAVDRILDSLTEDSSELIGWLNEGVREQLSQGQRVNVEKRLYEVAERLKSEEQRELSESCGIVPAQAFSKEKLQAIRQECEAVLDSFEKELKDAAGSVIQVMKDADVPLDATNRRFLTAIEGFLEVGPALRAWRPSESFLDKAADKDKWFSKANAKKYLPLLGGALDEPLDHFVSLFGAPFRVYNTAVILKDQTFDLALAGDIYREFDMLLKEKNVLGIDDSNTILRGIIDGSDAPFVYEKLGVRFEHFLLDEFQDTSTIQWQNFLPLLNESESNGHDNLVVGDVKQSIYRWRGSDWQLLASELPSQFPSAEVEPLSENWRSCANIVKFNNALFDQISDALELGELYSDVKQTVKCKDTAPGQVRVTFCAKEDELQRVLDSVNEVHESGAGYGDIAVLVRKNTEGGAVADALREGGIPVISDDSLNIKASVTVRRLVSLLSCVENPGDTVNSYLAKSLKIDFPDSSLSLFDLCEHLLRELEMKEPERYRNETLYIQSFMDFLHEWCSANGNSLTGFLKHWDETTTPCLSSPEDADAVRILTVHKSKGLEFSHVIFPFAESVGFYRDDWHWCTAEDEKMPSVSSSMFPVRLTEGTEHSLFSDRLQEEKKLQLVDNLNTFYVALTRPEKSLHIIACKPSATYRNGGPARDFSQLLYSFCGSGNCLEKVISEDCDDEIFEFGQAYSWSGMKRKERVAGKDFLAHFSSYPLDGRLSLNTDAADFFGDDGSMGAEASARLGGIVLHDILSKVRTPSDLQPAVLSAVHDGRLTKDEGLEISTLLADRIKSVGHLGWFPESLSEDIEIYNEVAIFDTDGQEYRPDKVVVSRDGVFVIDYKFGGREESYNNQVRRYMRLYRRMGYASVRGYVWYVRDGYIKSL